MHISGFRPRLAALLTAIVACVGLPGLSSLPAWAAAGTVTEFNVPGGVFGITAGPDGNLWFTGAGAIGRITPSGAITLFPVPGSAPGAITAGPDGNLWFLDNGTGKIGRITPAGSITEFPLPTTCGSSNGCGPYAIAAGPDGALWFTEAANDIGRITPAGLVTQFPVAGVCVPNEGCGAFGITSGPDGNLWFTEGAADNTDDIGRITPEGLFTAFPLPTDGSDGSEPYNITAGPDGKSLWFTEVLAREIGRITTQ
jgi:streptogramin lyase